MINPDKLSWEQILSFFKTLKLSPSSSVSTVRHWYKGEFRNFEETLSLLKLLGIIKIVRGQIILAKEIQAIQPSHAKMLRKSINDAIFGKNSYLLKPYDEFFNGFIEYKKSYIFIPNTKERLKYSGIRNFLISLEVLEFNSDLRGYIAKDILIEFLSHRDRVFSYKQFLKKNSSNEKLGLATEILIYEMEKELFRDDLTLQKKIKHVSLENVLAGYDILSFRKSKENKVIPRYIEVKAVSFEDWKFYWSRNEIEKAKMLSNKYFLYLVVIDNYEDLNSSSIYQIENPYARVFLDNKNWQKEIESFSFKKKVD